jgi:hypothetical protein
MKKILRWIGLVLSGLVVVLAAIWLYLQSLPSEPITGN